MFSRFDTIPECVRPSDRQNRALYSFTCGRAIGNKAGACRYFEQDNHSDKLQATLKHQVELLLKQTMSSSPVLS